MRIFALILSLLITTAVFAQGGFTEGHVITLEYDTLSGYLRNSSGHNRCFFKESKDTEVTGYQPGDIVGFRINGGKYFVSDSILIQNEMRSVFLEYLVDGVADLYYIRDEGDRYFLRKDFGELRELEEVKKMVTVNGVKKLKTEKKYVGLLKYAFRDSPEFLSSVDEVDFSHKSLIRISKRYHENVCPDEECLIYSRKFLKPSVFGLVVSYSQEQFAGTATINPVVYYLQGGYQTSGFFRYGAFYETNFSALGGKTRFKTELTYGKSKIDQTKHVPSVVFSRNHNRIVLDRAEWRASFMIYKQIFGSTKTNVSVGLGTEGRFVKIEEFKRAGSRNLPIEREPVEVESPFSNFNPALSAGVRIERLLKDSRKMHFNVTYHKAFLLIQGINNNGLTLNSISAGTGVQLFKN